MNQGYIVIGPGAPLKLSQLPGGPKTGVLVIGITVTVFPTRNAAFLATERTRRYARRENRPRPEEHYRVAQLETPQEAAR